jgi:hypothetical protein
MIRNLFQSFGKVESPAGWFSGWKWRNKVWVDVLTEIATALAMVAVGVVFTLLAVILQN